MKATIDTGFACACGALWSRTGAHSDGWELVRALNSGDDHVRKLAQSTLLHAGARSLSLLEAALSLKRISPERAAPCLLELIATLTGARDVN